MTLNRVDLGIRPNAWWGKYKTPFRFNVIVNDMSDVAAHEDVPLSTAMNFGIQSCSGTHGYRLSAKK